MAEGSVVARPVATVSRPTITVAVPVALASVALLLATPDADSRALAAAALAMVNTAVWFIVALWNRDRTLPVFEIGSILIAVTVLYAVYPIFAFLMSGSVWTAVSDNRLKQWYPDARALAPMVWGQAGYVAAFAAVYLHLRGRAAAGATAMRRLSRAGILVLVWLVLALSAYFWFLWIVYGVTYSPSYSDVRLGLVGVPRDLPYLTQQIAHNLRGVLLVAKLCLLGVLIDRWSQPVWRFALTGWLLFEVVSTALRMGARSDVITLLLAAGLLYHRLVRPLSARAAGMAAAVLLGAALLYGFTRDFQAKRAGSGMDVSYWSAANEFQILLGTAYDVQMRRNRGDLGPIPWQLHVSDALLLVPSQLLPVSKVDPAQWYIDRLGDQPPWAGLMFGVTAQAVLGLGWIELLLRGALLGGLFALLHRWYVRRADTFWASMLYVYICVYAYYTFRASSFYWLYFVLYRFVPTMLFVRAGASVLRRLGRAERGR
jgi:hypothetical protein